MPETRAKRLGRMVVSRPAGFESGRGAVALVHLYGPRGGSIGSAYIDREDATDAVNRLSSFVGAVRDKQASDRLKRLLMDARRDVSEDDDKWARLAYGQDTEEAEESGRLIGYAEGLQAALDLLEGA